MKHSWGHRVIGNCYSAKRRLNVLDSCTAYVSFYNYFTTMPVTNQTQYYLNGYNYNISPKPKFNEKFNGYNYNTSYMPDISFPDYYFDTTQLNTWNTRTWSPFDPLPYTQTYFGPIFANNSCVIPLTKNPETPALGLKLDRPLYKFLDADPANILSSLQDPLHFTGVYPYSPTDQVTLQKPAGWMYTNTAVPEPYGTTYFYEDGGSSIDRSKQTTSQLNYLPFKDALNVYNKNETLISTYDGLAFVIYFGEMHFNLPFNDLPTFEGLIPDPAELAADCDPTLQYFGIEVDIFLTSTSAPTVKSPRIGRLRWWRNNRPTVSLPTFNPEWNYFNILFEMGITSYVVPSYFKVLPSQGGGTAFRKLVLSNLQVNIGG